MVSKLNKLVQAGLSIGGEYPEARYIQKLDDVCRSVCALSSAVDVELIFFSSKLRVFGLVSRR